MGRSLGARHDLYLQRHAPGAGPLRDRLCDAGRGPDDDEQHCRLRSRPDPHRPGGQPRLQTERWRPAGADVHPGVAEGLMAYSLIDDDGGAVPLLALSKAGLAAWRESAPPHERDWVAATGFTAEAGKLALVPGKKGGVGRVLVGRDDGEAALWAFAGLSEQLPEGSYRIDALPEGGEPTRMALGWALGTYAFARHR